jgi:hypothetical protein
LAQGSNGMKVTVKGAVMDLKIADEDTVVIVDDIKGTIIDGSDKTSIEALKKHLEAQGIQFRTSDRSQEQLIIAEQAFDIDAPSEPRIEIAMPPGQKMTDWAAIAFSRNTVERVFEPLVADFQQEHIEALAAGARKSVMRGITIRYWAAYVLAFLFEGCSQIGKLVKAIRGAG